MERKGFGPRLGAALIDFAAMVVVSIVLGFIFLHGFVMNFGIPSRGGTVSAASVGAYMAYGIVSSLIGLAYFSTEIFMAASPGHKILGMKIMRQDGAPADQGLLIKRFCIRRAPEILALLGAIPLIGLVFGFVNIVVTIVIIVSCFMTLRVTKLALHDEWSQTAMFGPASVSVGFPVQPMGTMPVTPPPPTAS